MGNTNTLKRFDICTSECFYVFVETSITRSIKKLCTEVTICIHKGYFYCSYIHNNKKTTIKDAEFKLCIIVNNIYPNSPSIGNGLMLHAYNFTHACSHIPRNYHTRQAQTH